MPPPFILTKRALPALPPLHPGRPSQKRPLPPRPPTPPPALPLSPPPADILSAYYARREGEEIYVSSASVIELDFNVSAPSSSSDSGIYNASTNTGCSSSSGGSDKQERCSSRDTEEANTFCKTVYAFDGFYKGYEEQEVSVWIDLSSEEEDLYATEEPTSEFVYESIYEAVPIQQDAEVKICVGLNDKDSNLTRIATVAGKRIRKLRRNWSLTKDDFSKGLSKIKRSSKTLIEDVYSKEVKFSSVGRRKISLSQLLSPDLSQQRSRNNPTFYIGLPVDTPCPIPGKEILLSEAPHPSEKSTPRICPSTTISPPSLPSTAHSSDTTTDTAPVAPTRRKSGKRGQQQKTVIRPIEPPPAPPSYQSFNGSNTFSTSPLPTHFFTILGANSSQEPPIVTSCLANVHPSTILNGIPAMQRQCDHGSQSSYLDKQPEPLAKHLLDKDPTAENVNLPESAESEVEETYMSCLIKSEPLYQFYDRRWEVGHDNYAQTDSQKRKYSNSDFANNFNSNQENICDKNPAIEYNDDSSGHCSLLSEIVSDCSAFNKDPLGMVSKLGADIWTSSDSNLLYKTTSSDQIKTPTCPKKREQKSSVQELVIGRAGHRTLWSELPEVIESGVLDSTSPGERRLQEAMFEILSSEASYLKSLNVLNDHFASSRKFTSVLTDKDRDLLFSQIHQVRSCSERFLQDLETRWQENLSPLLSGICDIILKHARNHFQVFISYCSNQVTQDRTLKRLKSENCFFAEVLTDLESSPVCQSLSMYSFLMLPMQRITRLPLLVAAILNHLPPTNPEHTICTQLLSVLNKLVRQCNEAAREVERREELIRFATNIDFRAIKPVHIVQPDRWLVKQARATRILWKEGTEKLTFGRRVNKQSVELLLFTDLLIICKKKGDEKFAVVDHAPRALITVSEFDVGHSIPGLTGGDGGGLGGFLQWLTLLQNSDQKTQEMLLSFKTESERARWTEMVTPAASKVPGEKIYESWDCPRIQVTNEHLPEEPDELDVRKGDTANVLKKTSDDWLFVERCSDGRQGWLPAGVTMELESDHRRAKNFRQRYQFLKALSEANNSDAA